MQIKRFKRVHVFIMVLVAVLVVGAIYVGAKQAVKRGGRGEAIAQPSPAEQKAEKGIDKKGTQGIKSPGQPNTGSSTQVADTSGWKTFDPETAYGAGSIFDVKYPSDWHEIQLRERGALAFHEWPSDSDSCLITLGVGGSGVQEGEADISVETNSKMYGDLSATKQIFKQSGQILVETTSFSRDNIDYIFELRTQKEADYDKCKQDYEDILATFKFL